MSIEKSTVQNKLIYHFEQLCSELNNTLLNLKAEAALTEDETVNMDDASYQNHAVEMIEHYQNLLNNSSAELKKLQSYEKIICHTIQPGALVITEELMIFIGVATPKLHLKDHQILIGISEESPLYKNMHGKKIGEFIPMDDKSLKIRSIL